MKKLFAILFLSMFITMATDSLSHAQNAGTGTGVGVILGEPTGLTLKSWTGGNNAFDVGLAWSFGGNDAVHIHADYLWHRFDVFQDLNKGALPVYYGIGGRIVFAENDAVLGVRTPVGLNYLFEDSPIGLFFEIAPVINVIPSTDFDVNGGIGVRIYI